MCAGSQINIAQDTWVPWQQRRADHTLTLRVTAAEIKQRWSPATVVTPGTRSRVIQPPSLFLRREMHYPLCYKGQVVTANKLAQTKRTRLVVCALITIGHLLLSNPRNHRG